MTRLEWGYRAVPGAGVQVYSSITEEEIECLSGLARGGRVLEIGTAYGYAAIMMVLGDALSVTTIDPHHGEVPRSLAATVANIAAVGVEDKVYPIVGRSQDVLPALIAANAYFDLVFIDGDHSKEMVVHDLKAANQLIGQWGVIVCHDYGEDTCPGVKEALDELVPEGRPTVGTLWIQRGNLPVS